MRWSHSTDANVDDLLDLRSVHSDWTVESEDTIQLPILVKGLEIVGERSSIALCGCGSTWLASQVSIRIIVVRTGSHAIIVVEISTIASRTVSRNNRTSHARSRTGPACYQISHQIGPVNAGG